MLVDVAVRRRAGYGPGRVGGFLTGFLPLAFVIDRRSADPISAVFLATSELRDRGGWRSLPKRVAAREAILLHELS